MSIFAPPTRLMTVWMLKAKMLTLLSETEASAETPITIKMVGWTIKQRFYLFLETRSPSLTLVFFTTADLKINKTIFP